MIKYLIVALLLLSVAIAQENFLNEESVTMNVQISGNITVDKGSSTVLDYVQADVYLFPKQDYRQTVLDKRVSSPGEILDQKINFKWEEPDAGKLSYILNYDVKTAASENVVKKKVSFPIKELPPEIEIYTRPTVHIDADNEEIIKLASEVVEGEDDLYLAVSKIAAWVENNIEYSLNTLTSDVSQKSSWVLLNRFGVCDELTSLFAAMARSLGIPVRYVSGLAYTNWQNRNDWGPHAWAEVYFPDVGWVPFDVTYRQLGFVDNSHIKMEESQDSVKASVEYSWLAYDFQPEFDELGFTTSLESKTGTLRPDVSLSVNSLKSLVGLGSFNGLEITVQNLKDHYLTTNLIISRSRGLRTQGRSKFVALKPGETKKVYWPVQVWDGLDTGYVYTFPVSVFTHRNISGSTTFKAESGETLYLQSEIDDIINQRSDEEEKEYSKNVDLDCGLEKNFYYAYEDAVTNCVLKNTGNVFLTNVSVCLGGDCQETNLGIAQEKNFNFSLIREAGLNERQVVAFNQQVSKSEEIVYDYYADPNVELEDITYPSSVAYGETFDISLNFIPLSELASAEVVVVHKNFRQQWRITKIGEQTLTATLDSRDLAFTNDFEIIARFTDKNGKEYQATDSFSLELTNLSLFQKIAVFLKNLVP